MVRCFTRNKIYIIPEYNKALERVDELEDEVKHLRELRIKDAEEIGRLRGQIEVLKQSLAEGDNAQEIGRLKGELEFLKRALPPEIKKLLGLEWYTFQNMESANTCTRY